MANSESETPFAIRHSLFALSAKMRAVRFDTDRIQRLAGRHEQAVALLAAQANIGAAFGQADLADTRAPTGRCPQRPGPSAGGIKSLLMPRSWSWLHSALSTRVHCIERCRAADVKSVSLLTAEAQVGDSFRYMDLAEQIAVSSVAAHAVLVRIAPTHGAPNTPFGVTAHPVGNAGLGHFRKDFAVRHLSAPHIQVEHADMRRVVRPVGEAGVEDIELLLVRREGNAVGLHEVIDDNFDVTRFRIRPVDVMLFLLRLGFDALIIAADAVDGIGEPERTIGSDERVLRG